MMRVNEFLLDALKYLNTLPDLEFVHSGKRVLVVGFTPQWMSYMSLVSLVLAHRGCRLDFLWTPIFEHDNAKLLDTLEQMRREFYPTFAAIDDDRFRPINALDVPISPLSPEQTAQVEEQARWDTIHFCREVRIDIADRHHGVYHRRMQVLSHFAGALETTLNRTRYDLLLTPNGQIFEWGIARRIAMMHGLPVSTLEMIIGGSDFQICASWDQPAINWNTEIIAEAWKADEPHVATDEVKENVRILMGRYNNREDVISHQFVESGQVAALRASLDLDPSKPVALVMPSLGHEKHNRLSHRGFVDHVDWFESCVGYLARRTDCNVVIRCHPFPYDAIKDPLNHGASGELPDRLLAEMFAELPPHFRLIGPQDAVNSYDLLEIGNFVLTHHSTIAREAALIGRAAVTCSTIHYADKGFTLDAKTRDEYFAIIDELIRDPAKRTLSERQIELAQCYANVFYFKWPKPFPWNIMRPFFRHQDYPLERVLSIETMVGPMMDTFDSLVARDPVADGIRARQVEVYAAAVRALSERGDIAQARRLIGSIENIDLPELWRRHPQVFTTLTREWPWLVGLAVEQGDATAMEVFRRQARKTLEALTAEGVTADDLSAIGTVAGE